LLEITCLHAIVGESTLCGKASQSTAGWHYTKDKFNIAGGNSWSSRLANQFDRLANSVRVLQCFSQWLIDNFGGCSKIVFICVSDEVHAALNCRTACLDEGVSAFSKIIPQVHPTSREGVFQYLSELDAFHRAATQHVFKQELELFDLIVWELELLRLGFGKVAVEANIKEVGIMA
jgi:hypothetical protein